VAPSLDRAPQFVFSSMEYPPDGMILVLLRPRVTVNVADMPLYALRDLISSPLHLDVSTVGEWHLSES